MSTKGGRGTSKKKNARRPSSERVPPPEAGTAQARKTSSKKKPSESQTKPSARASSPPSADALPSARYLFFGGKGGVGKTTAAASAAMLLLDSAGEGEQLLLFSTDPAHSLSDSLGTEIGDRTVEVARRGAARLFAREMDAARALEEFKARHRGVLKEIADRGTLLDDADINDLLDLSLPGLDEVMSLFELSELERTGTYARVVVDTAPSGHTSRLLRLPEVFARWVGALDLMSEKHRYIVAQFARGRRVGEDEVESFLRELTERVGRVRSVVYDGARSAFTLVTVPEALSVEETARYLALLRAERVPVTDLIVNRVAREHDACALCRARASSQTRWLSRIERDFADLRLRRVPLLPAEVRGPEALRRFARLAWGDEDDAATRRRRDAAIRGDELTSDDESIADRDEATTESLSVAAPPRRRVAASRFTLEPRRLLIFGGKGGVGKTTAAASAALALAESGAGRVLVFSTDPAHSLSDSFEERVGELKRGVAGAANLDASEIDPARRFEELKERYRSWTDALFESLTGGSRWEVKFDREAMRELVALAPPGIDEIAALSGISDLLEEGRYASIVLDTAPTGHLLRFLELPDIALSWV
ncbi:MAG TPA: TRC40/GET3/ArsA family transport-energizing ATPase, partial [Pyrinomonadaceae bacterium]|nr:TRC40/GET3/ArsA family transport-energizing ATPase [Pyrinomonadaceae bacterium]